MNLRRLKYFLKIVDAGSLTQAAEVLHIAQPALSQQIATLEEEFAQKLLVRTKLGVTPTRAGWVLYRHAQSILKQIMQAQADVHNTGQVLSGDVSVGLSPGTAASFLALPLLKAVRRQHPDLVIGLNENLGSTLIEKIGKGEMDMAVLYASLKPDPGLSFEYLMMEEMVLVVPEQSHFSLTEATLAEIHKLDLLLPRRHSHLRQHIDEAFRQIDFKPKVLAELESADTLAAALQQGIAASILPASTAQAIQRIAQVRCCRIVSPSIEVPLVLCTSDHLPLSEPAQAVRAIILQLMAVR